MTIILTEENKLDIYNDVIDCDNESIYAVIYTRGVTLGSYIGEASFFEVFNYIQEIYNIRDVFLIGYSGAGAGALALAQNYPGLFSGIVSISGLCNGKYLGNLNHVPLMVFSSYGTDILYYNVLVKPFKRLKEISNFKSVLPDKLTHRELMYYIYHPSIYKGIRNTNCSKEPFEFEFFTERNRYRRAYYIEIDYIPIGKTYSKLKIKYVNGTFIISTWNITGILIILPSFVDRNRFKIEINSKLFEFTNYNQKSIYFYKYKKKYFFSEENSNQNRISYKGIGMLDVFFDRLIILKPNAIDENVNKISNNFSSPQTNGEDPRIKICYPIQNIGNLALSSNSNYVIFDNLICKDYYELRDRLSIKDRKSVV